MRLRSEGVGTAALPRDGAGRDAAPQLAGTGCPVLERALVLRSPGRGKANPALKKPPTIYKQRKRQSGGQPFDSETAGLELVSQVGPSQ